MCNARPIILLHEIHMSPSLFQNLLTQVFSYRMFWLGYRRLKWQTDGESPSVSNMIIYIVFEPVNMKICIVFEPVNMKICIVVEPVNMKICIVFRPVNIKICIVFEPINMKICIVFEPVNMKKCIVFEPVKGTVQRDFQPQVFYIL